MGKQFYEFGRFRLDIGGRVLYCGEERVSLTPKAVETLVLLVENHGHMVGKGELMGRIWPDTFVEESSLTRNISVLRKVLGKSAEGREFIETIPKRGYCFAAPVEQVPDRVVSSTAAKIMLAVLPFENLSGDKKQEYFSDGLTEEMITQLGRLNPERLGVIARTSAMKYKSADWSIRQIGRELGVSYILEGSVRRDGTRVRIAAHPSE